MIQIKWTYSRRLIGDYINLTFGLTRPLLKMAPCHCIITNIFSLFYKHVVIRYGLNFKGIVSISWHRSNTAVIGCN